MATVAPVRRPPSRIPNQVILSGPKNQVDRLLSATQPGSGTTPPPRNRTAPTPPAITWTTLAEYHRGPDEYKAVLVQYTKPPANDQTETLNETLLQIARTAGLTAVRTEPNCTVAAPPAWRRDPFSWEGNAFSLEGNDIFSWEGNPFSWEGDPHDLPAKQSQPVTPKVMNAGSTPAEGANLFVSQDAFQRIQVAKDGKRNPLLETYKGEGVLVALFDSCPSADLFANLEGGTPAWLSFHPCKAPTPLASGPYVDHGLFNASLINFVAPSADIHLYQVLNGEMFGETAWLIAAMAHFLDHVAGNRPSVINLSLGSMCCGNGSMPAVEGILWELVRRGGVICAAAGNRGRKARKPSGIPPAQMPAALPYVIAVAASNRQTIRASYSQRGDIAAPGGDTMGEGPDGFDDIIGMGTSSLTGYVRMDCGTSFATPLVAGAAALALSDLMKRGAPHDSGLWRRVMDRLALSAIQPMGAEGTSNTTGLGAGIIQVSGHRLVPNG